MAGTIKVNTTQFFQGSKVLLSGGTTRAGDQENSGEVDVDDGAADQLIDLSFLLSKLKFFGMQAVDAEITVETNSAGSPQETFTLAAGEIVKWEEGETAIFAGDVTAIYVTNSSGTDAILKFIALVEN